MTEPTVQSEMRAALDAMSQAVDDNRGKAILGRNNILRAGVHAIIMLALQRGQDAASAVAIGALQKTNDEQAAAIAALQNRALDVHTANLALPGQLISGGTKDYTVTWDAPFPDTNYLVRFLPCSAMSGATYVVKAKAKDTVTITVTTTALIAAGSVLNLIGYRLA